MLDYQQAKKLKAEADEAYRKMAMRIRRQTIRLKKNLQNFGKMKHEAYTVVIRNAVKILAKYSTIDLTEYKSFDISNIRISAYDNTAFINSMLRKKTSILNEAICDIGLLKITKGLNSNPYAGILMTGITLGMNGHFVKTKAEEVSTGTKVKIERMVYVLSELKAIQKRITEGESLLYALSRKLKASLWTLQTLACKEDELSEEASKEIDISISLIKSIKRLIETEIFDTNGFLSEKSAAIFRKIE